MKQLMFKTIRIMYKPFKGKGLSQTALGKFIYRNIYLSVKPDYIELEGFKFYLHKGYEMGVDKTILRNEYEPIETKVLKNIIKEGDIVLDLGANIGYYTVLFSKLVGKKGKVYSFEPEPRNFELLKKNVKVNNCNNVELINKAVTDTEGKINLYVNDKDLESSTINLDDNHQNVIGIESVNLNNMFKDRVINFIKIDVEGAELKVLKGASEVLKNKMNLMLEFKPQKDRINKDCNNIISLLKEKDFKIFDIDRTKGGLTEFDNSPKNYHNLLCRK